MKKFVICLSFFCFECFGFDCHNSYRKWTQEEDDKLRSLVSEVGENSWSYVSKYIPGRNRAQCEQRWFKSINSERKKGSWTAEEDQILISFIDEYNGKNKWKEIAKHIEVRSDTQCKQRWMSTLDPSILRNKWTREEDEMLFNFVMNNGEHSWIKASSIIHGRSASQCRGRWMDSINPNIKKGTWNAIEDENLSFLVEKFGTNNWTKVSKFMDGRTPLSCRSRWVNHLDKNVNNSMWTPEEDILLLTKVRELGRKWSVIRTFFVGKSDMGLISRYRSLSNEYNIERFFGYSVTMIQNEYNNTNCDKKIDIPVDNENVSCPKYLKIKDMLN